MSETFATAEIEADATLPNIPAPSPEPAPAIKPGKEPIGGHAPEIQNNDSGQPQPEYMPDKFWNAETQTPNVEQMAKSYSELETAHTTKTEALRTDIERKFHEGRLSQRPEAASDYKAQPPDGFLPSDTTFNADEGNPMLKFWRETAYNLGLSQPQFESGIAAFIDNVMHDAPNPDQAMASLGENGKDRFDSVQTWLQGQLGEDALQHFGPVLGSGEGVQYLEKVIAMTKDYQQGGGQAPTGAKGKHTKESLEALMKTPGYADPHKRDPRVVQEVQDGWKALIPDPEEMLRTDRR
ncbi:MAG: hypothetical protein CME71_11810 [Halobacteriovorax sp.]|nr:hypothetical protein [Halobacteriovorax sp.]|tara:strand:- start:9680 stop:10564 length:885 start_codon:yes stop_codon:yes gene_type:complete